MGKNEDPVILKVFGSRSCGYVLPSSDLDLVCEFRPSRAYDRRTRFADSFLEQFLQSVCQQLKGHSACSDVKDTIDAKFTVTFTFGKQLRVDCTACVGGHSHLASSQTKAVRQALNDLPAIGTSLVLLVVDRMKHHEYATMALDLLHRTLKQ